MNVLHIIGNLTANPKIRVVTTSEGEKPVCDFTVAVNRYAGGAKHADYFRVTLWDRMAENAAQYLSKGSKVAISGPVECRAYTDSDGAARASLEIRNVKEIEYLGSRKESGSEQNTEDGYIPVEDELPF